MKKNFALLLILFPFFCFSQGKATATFNKEEIKINSLLNGSLYTPSTATKKMNLVILIAGSGPTDRDGNQYGVTNNSLKYTSEGLVKNGIAVFSYDKRIIAQMEKGTIDERALSFDDFINDAKTVVTYFKNQKIY